MSETTETETPEAPKKTVKRRRRRPQLMRRFEVKIGAKRIQADDASVVNGLLIYVIDSTWTYLPITKQISVLDRSPSPATFSSGAPSQFGFTMTRPIYDPQLPHTAEGNLTVEQLEEAERRRKAEVERFRRDRNSELEDATHAGGSLPYTPGMV